MIGSISLVLKSHSITLYGVGKLDDASVAKLCKDLLTLERTKFEGELKEFANHAFSFQCALQNMQKGSWDLNVLLEIQLNGFESQDVHLRLSNSISI